MQFITSRLAALDRLKKFIEGDISNYNSKRNFDYGVNNRRNVSCLSPYITHRLITEYETTKLVLLKHPFQKVDKFIQEIFWRVYWKGWLEMRPSVWTDFIEDINMIEEDKKYIKAINGETEIECFNDWVNELKNFNYLHNHTRMLFASIWIFTLGLPWQKGAEFFMKHLYDGDAASNTLSWRWVAGLQTRGKHYVAQAWNINKFTNNRYKNMQLNESALPIIDKREYKIKPIKINKSDALNEALILFENDLCIETLNLKNYSEIFCILLSNKKRKIQIDDKVLNYKKKLIEDQVIRHKKIKLIDEKLLEEKLVSVKSFDVIYPSVGENLSYLKNLRKNNDLNLNYITREGDEYCWQFSTKGYFNFKSHIPKIFQKLKLSI